VNDNGSSFEAVVMPHLSDALALARWLTKNRADAEDVLQEACLRAFRSIGGYAGGNARAWLLAIVRNTAFSWMEKNRSTELVSVENLDAVERTRLEDSDAWLDGRSSTPETDLIAKADAARLEAAISALPVEFRETLVLRDIQGLEYREIAQVIAVPVGTVMSRLSRARRLLVRALTEQS
jgi:RNA polymerase sigma factor (sigma-70 family)